MENTVQNMRWDERTALLLRRLYESRGFRRVRPGKFEEHALYMENKNFFHSENMITFMDLDGRLLALKPDITLSVIKNIPSGPLPTFQKLYYLDEVFRISRESREYRACNQIGVELLGPADPFTAIEVADLALCSLELVGESYVLDVSHLGFVSGMLEHLEVSHTVAGGVLRAIHAKSPHEVRRLLSAAGVSEAALSPALRMAELHGDLAEALPKAWNLVANNAMRQAWEELNLLAESLKDNGFDRRVHLDFSVVNDLDYYNGLVFQGYVEGVHGEILSGGRYDNLMAKMGKESGAMGFAVSLDRLESLGRESRPHDFDLLVTYGADSHWPTLLREVKDLCGKGYRVRLEREGADIAAADFTWKRHLPFQNNHLAGKEDLSC